MARSRKILLADPEESTLRALARALRERGYQVSATSDGSRALEIAVLRHPDLVLFDESCRFVDARTFIQILRTNPRTEAIPVVVTGSSKDLERLRGFRDGYLRKPFNIDDVLGRITHILRKVDTAREMRGESREIEGSLKQMCVADVLQILATSRRTGTLSLEHGDERGEVHLTQGRPVQARLGRVDGEKAFFRLLALTEGSFAFSPGPFPGPPRIHRGMEEELIEGMRQADESAALWARLPSRQTRVVLTPNADLSQPQHPVTAEVVPLLAEPRSLSDLLDRTAATDFEVLSAVSALLDKGLARTVEGAGDPEGGPILSAADRHAVRARILKGRQAARLAVGKVLLVSNSRRTLRAFLDKLGDLPGYRLLRPPSPELMGTWARLELPDGLRLDLCSVPGADEARPLWKPFTAGALGALVLDRGDASIELAQFLVRDARVPLLFGAGGAVPAHLGEGPGVSVAPTEPREALRALLSTATRDAEG